MLRNFQKLLIWGLEGTCLINAEWAESFLFFFLGGEGKLSKGWHTKAAVLMFTVEFYRQPVHSHRRLPFRLQRQKKSCVCFLQNLSIISSLTLHAQQAFWRAYSLYTNTHTHHSSPHWPWHLPQPLCTFQSRSLETHSVNNNVFEV